MNLLCTAASFLLLMTGFLSCKTSSTDFATEWTIDIKEKIISDANEQYDRAEFDSVYYTLTLFKGDRKLKHFVFRPKFDTTNGKVLILDTVASIFYSADQNFELVRELCPAIDRSFEGIKFKGIGSVGLTEFRFCNGKIKERGFRYGYKAVGVWKKYDSAGNVIGSIDNGNVDDLNKLRSIKYRH